MRPDEPLHPSDSAAPAPTGSFGDELITELVRCHPRSRLTHLRHEPARHSVTTAWPEWVEPSLREYLISTGITSLYSHQASVATAAHSGRDVVVATGTASGKSLGYQLPILTTLATDPTASALYISPTKALAQDQQQSITAMCTGAPGLRHIMTATYDGDTLAALRRTIRDDARLIITNPDMIHTSMLRFPQQWARLLRSLRYIVIDEAHAYRGVFGAHVSLVLRRLLRLTTRPDISLIIASATNADPIAHATRLSGRDNWECITADGSPRGERTIALWEPGLLPDATGEHGAPVRRSANAEAAELMGQLVAQGARTLTFVRSRRGAEYVALGAATELSTAGRSADARRIAAYRAGYTADDRRDLERRLDNGELLGVATTNALELGIDVGGLDCVISTGFPGTISSFHQQAGRAGRRGQGSLVMLVSSDNPLDTFLINHPEALLDKPVESIVFNPHNPYVLADHVICAAAERPLSLAEVEALGAHGVVEQLLRQGWLRRRGQGLFANVRVAAEVHNRMSLRSSGGERIAIVDRASGRFLGEVDHSRALSELHDGAVYVHQGETYLVTELNLHEAVAWVEPAQPDYTTHVLQTTNISVTRSHGSQHLGRGVWLADLDVAVTHQITAYRKRSPGGDILDVVPLDVPPDTLHTRSVAYTVDPTVLDELGLPEPTWPGTLHAAEHAAIGMLPLLATCDRWDIGGVSTALHPDTGLPTVFVYDGYAGGAGFAEQGFQRFHEWIAATASAVSECPCSAGCPSCVQSPKCGNGNNPLFKTGAATLLTHLARLTAAPPAPRSH